MITMFKIHESNEILLNLKYDNIYKKAKMKFGKIESSHTQRKLLDQQERKA